MEFFFLLLLVEESFGIFIYFSSFSSFFLEFSNGGFVVLFKNVL